LASGKRFGSGGSQAQATAEGGKSKVGWLSQQSEKQNRANGPEKKDSEVISMVDGFNADFEQVHNYPYPPENEEYSNH